MQKSEFRFSNPRLVHLNFQLNDSYQKPDGSDKQSALYIDTSINKIQENEAVVELTVKLGEPVDSYPFFIELTMRAKFRLEHEIEETNFENFLEVNAPALLLSYARPIISSITSNAGMKPVNLPFLNFSTSSEEKVAEAGQTSS